MLRRCLRPETSTGRAAAPAALVRALCTLHPSALICFGVRTSCLESIKESRGGTWNLSGPEEPRGEVTTDGLEVALWILPLYLSTVCLAANDQRSVAELSNADLSLDARLLYVSNSIGDILGYHPEEVVGKSCWEYFHPDEIPFAKAIHGRGVELDKAAVLNYCQIKSKDGTWVGCEYVVICLSGLWCCSLVQSLL